jgi:hypothetical protein
MLSSLPFSGDYPIIQPSAANPQTFNRLTCSGVKLRGHQGIDFGLPLGAQVLAVAEGEVLATGDDPKGFGHYIVLGHAWGQSLYAHLSRIDIEKGQPVDGGEPIALSGDSGVANRPHLHFGMRIVPFSTADGWCGYSDPQPYLTRLTAPRGPLIGAHIIAGVHRHLAVLARWQPRLITVLDPNPDELRQLRAACPNSSIVGRIFAPDQQVADLIRKDPAAAAEWAHASTLARLTPDVNYWQFANEVHQDRAGLPLLNRFELKRMALAESAGYRCAILGFSVGNPDLPEYDRMAHWRLVYPALDRAERLGHIVALHQYGAPTLWGPDDLYDWYFLRFEHQVLRLLPYKHLQFAVTEAGVDGSILGGNPQGWTHFLTPEEYVNQLLKAGRYLERFSGRTIGHAIFTLGAYTPWGSYDIQGYVAQQLAARAERGTWATTDTRVAGIAPGTTDTTTQPGPETPVVRTSAGCKESGPDVPPPLVRRFDDRFHAYHLSIKPIWARPDRPAGSIVYLIKDVFMTMWGSWEDNSSPDDVPAWARHDYLTPDFLEAGADHHLFGTVIGLDGTRRRFGDHIFWSDGFYRLGDPSYKDYYSIAVKPESGWSNFPMSGSSSFAPDRGQSGPWCWMPPGPAEVIVGGGLPHNHHMSTFVVWQAYRRADLPFVLPGALPRRRAHLRRVRSSLKALTAHFQSLLPVHRPSRP